MDIININNETAKMKLELDRIIDKQNELKTEADEVRSKRLNKVSELAQILMAIDNIETTCLTGKGSGTKNPPRHPVQDIESKPKDLYNNPIKRVEYAKKQLVSIKNYLTDYKLIHQNVIEQDKQIGNYVQSLKDKNELI